MTGQTPSQTVGPFFAYGLTPEPYGRRGIAGNVLVSEETQGEHVRLEGRVIDGRDEPIPDAMVEIWQANARGRYSHPSDDRDGAPLDPHFTGFGRAATDETGTFRFDTVKPGRVPGRGNTLQAPHVNVIIFARGMLVHAFTRLYFADETGANGEDPVLGTVEDARRGTLLAERVETPGGVIYRFDVHMQGERETVFFDV
ncbi:MAG: protocatechuate 3,4-dioxygenase subunit alpha [Alphaproteobacteria bacterium]